MTLNLILLLVCLIWLVSEVVLARIKHSKRTDLMDRDKSSLRILWMTILIFVPGRILIGATGIGFMAVRYHFFSLLGLVLITAGLAVRWTAILFLEEGLFGSSSHLGKACSLGNRLSKWTLFFLKPSPRGYKSDRGPKTRVRLDTPKCQCRDLCENPENQWLK